MNIGSRTRACKSTACRADHYTMLTAAGSAGWTQTTAPLLKRQMLSTTELRRVADP